MPSAPPWFLDMIIVLGALIAVGNIAAPLDTSLLRRKPSTVRARAASIAAHHRSGWWGTTTRPAPGHVFPMLGRDVAGQADTQLAMAPAAASPPQNPS